MNGHKSEHEIVDTLEHRLSNATDVELKRLSEILGFPSGSTYDEIRNAYLEAADNSLANLVRNYIPSDEPTYSKILRLIFMDQESLTKSWGRRWQRVRSLKVWDHVSDIDVLTDEELESDLIRILDAKNRDLKQYVAKPGIFKKMFGYSPGTISTVAGGMVTVTAATAWRLPFAGVAPGLIAGPIGIGLGVLMIGTKLTGPAFRKITPATIEIISIGQRLKYMPMD